MLDCALNEAGLTVSDVEIVECSLDKHLECYADFDAVVTLEPMRTKILAQGANQLFDSSQIPGLIVDVLTVLTTTTRTHQNSIEQLVAGYFRARQHLDAQPDDAAQRMSARLSITPAELLTAYEGLRFPSLAENHELLGSSPAPFTSNMDDLVIFLLDRQLLRHSVSTKDLIDSSFLPQDSP